MRFFEKKPRRRLLFVFAYVIFAIRLVVDDFAVLNVLFSILMLFGGYIAIVKSKIIKDKNANTIDDYKFDLSSVLLIVFLFIKILSTIFVDNIWQLFG